MTEIIHGTDLVYSMIGGDGKSEYTIGPKYWHVHEYFLHVNTGWFHFMCHVGDIPYDSTQNLKLTFEVPLK